MTLNLLQHCFCFVFCFLLFYFFDPEPWEILAPRSGTEPIPDTLEGKVLTTGPPGKPTSWTFLSEIGIFFNLKYMIIKNIITTNYCSLLLLLIGTHWSTSGFQLQSLLASVTNMYKLLRAFPDVWESRRGFDSQVLLWYKN